MRRVLGILLLVGVVGAAFGYVYYETSQRRLATERGRDERRIAATARLTRFVSTTGSSMGWDQGGDGAVDRALDQMLTVELERYWLAGHPILFVGAVSDVATADQRHYRLFVQYRPMLGTLLSSKDFHLEVNCAKEKAQPVIDALRNGKTSALGGPGIAVAARIAQVRRKQRPREGDETVLTGVGACIDVLYIEDLFDIGRR